MSASSARRFAFVWTTTSAPSLTTPLGLGRARTVPGDGRKLGRRGGGKTR